MIPKLHSALLKITALLCVCVMTFTAQAGTVSSTLDLTTSEPDISSGFISTSYIGNSSSGAFTATGFATGLTNMGVNEPIAGGSFDITANIQALAGTADGILNIGGSIAALGFNTGTLLTATLAQVGGPSAALNFVFNVTGGDAAALYGGVGAEVGVIMGFTGYNGIASFGGDFNSAAFAATANAFAVPLPSTVALFLIGFAALGVRRKV